MASAHLELPKKPQHEGEGGGLQVEEDLATRAADQPVLVLEAEHLVQHATGDLQERGPCGQHVPAANVQLQDVFVGADLLRLPL